MMSAIWRRLKPFAGLLPLAAVMFLKDILPRLSAWAAVSPRSLSWGSTDTYVLLFIAGACFPFLVKSAAKQVLSWTGLDPGDKLAEQDAKIYGLRHGVLNLDLSNTDMWMNMGYWEGQDRAEDFPRACKALLHELLAAAGLDGKRGASREYNIIDVGFGCGDQTLMLNDLTGLRSYVGITKNKQQFRYAQQRLHQGSVLVDLPTMMAEGKKLGYIRQVFCADAGKPDSWGAELRNHMAYCCYMLPEESVPPQETWVLALDVLYHFSPSRRPFFNHAFRGLKASIMAFDLLLPDPSAQRLSFGQTCMLRLVSIVTSTPYSNFLTPAQYRAQLVAAGYANEDIEIRDISEHVFGPLATYIQTQDQRLKLLGMGIGVFRAARLVFGWWGRTGVVRACVVTARTKTKTSSRPERT